MSLKLVVANLLNSPLLGSIISRIFPNYISSIRIPKIKINNSPLILNSTKAQFFWGFYESAELRFIRKYVPEGSNILELGASIGVVASVCFKLKNASRLLLVESNPELIPLIEGNLSLNGVKNAKILNKAVTSIVTNFWFNPGRDTVSGSISPTKISDKASIVEGVQLSDLIRQEKLDDFVLISDIEGSEISFILGSAKVLERCKMIIIELHRVVYEGIEYSVDDMIDLLIKNHRFTQIDRYGSVVAFTRSHN